MLNYEVVPQQTTPQTISTIINTIPYYKPETGYGVFKSKSIAILGIAHNAGIGKRITATGIIETHPEYGKQLKADSITVENPDDKVGLIRMLANAKIKGVGLTAATKIVNHYGVEVMHQLDAGGLKAAGLKDAQITAVLEYAGVNAGVTELLTLLGKAGIHSKTQAAIIANATYDEVKRNPFRLLEIPRMSFTAADAIWGVLNGDNKAATRIFAGVTVAMERQQDKGHSGMKSDELVEEAAKLLKIDPAPVRAVVNDKLASHNLIEFPKYSDCIYNYKVYQQEREIASLLTALQAVSPVRHTTIDNPMLSGEQLTGIHNAMIAGVSIITGGPGTGKSTLLLSLCDLATLNNLDIQLTAPTGMAANRMREATGRKAHTIHKFLLSRNKKPVLLVVDEASMLSTELMLALLRVIPTGSRLVLIGDADQLPSIQYGNVLNDLIDSGRFPVTRLTKTFRFKDDIGKLARDVIVGNKIVIGADINEAAVFIDCSGDDADLRINEVVMGLQGRFVDAQVLAPIRGGVAGTGELNQGLADLLNPGVNRDNFKGVGVGDRVVNTKNDYDKNLVNGYTGIVTNVDSQTVTVRYEVGDITQSWEDANIELAYALTVHKVQGQEYETVIIALSKRSPIMLQRRLLYTAVTRAKSKVIIVGTREALDIVQHGQFTEERLTGLAYHL